MIIIFHIFSGEDGKFRRMPEDVAKATSQGVFELHTFTSGGRVRFRTDSPYVAIHTKMPIIGRMSHDAMTGVSATASPAITSTRYLSAAR